MPRHRVGAGQDQTIPNERPLLIDRCAADGVRIRTAMIIAEFGGGADETGSFRELRLSTLRKSQVTAEVHVWRVYVSIENFNTGAENQILVVSSDNGGQTWSAPSRATHVQNINFPQNVDGRDTLTGCQLRYGAVVNSAAGPSDASGNTVYVALADNRSGDATATNTDVFLAKSTDGGASWSLITVDNEENDQFYPWVAVGLDGTVNVGYMDRSYGNASDPGDRPSASVVSA